MTRALLFDPHLFNNWQITPETTFALMSLHGFVLTDRKYDNYCIYSCEKLEVEYDRIFQNAKLKEPFIERFIGLILSRSQPIKERKIDLTQLDASFDGLPEHHRVLLELAASDPNIVIVLAEKEQYPHSPLYELKEKICIKLQREALISLTDFTNKLNVFTEGKTDWMHLKAALYRFKERGKYLGLQIDFVETTPGSGEGWSNLLQHCLFLSSKSEDRVNIFIFDRDVQNNLSSAKAKEFKEAKSYFLKPYHCWGNKVFSCMLPIPDHRCGTSDYVCIEFYYIDSDIVRKDKNDNRLFLDIEFTYGTGEHKTERLKCRHYRNKIASDELSKPKFILSREDVTTFENQPTGLSKSKFAENILMQTIEFQDMDISEFVKIFDLILEIRSAAKEYD